MSVTDPIADALTKIRNAYSARHLQVQIRHSRLVEAIVRILDEENYISGYDTIERDPAKGLNHRAINVNLRYTNQGEPIVRGITRASRPGLRVYVDADHIPCVYNNTGIAIISTSRGVMVDRQARKMRVGGEFLCRVW